MKRLRAACQNGVRRKSSVHHRRQRRTVRLGTFKRSHRCRIERPRGGELSINTTATYTRRLMKRTEDEVARFSHRPHVKLKRQEYSSTTAAGQPRGLRGKSATCSDPAHSGQPARRVSAANPNPTIF